MILYADHLGSIMATANSAGSSTAIYAYGPYGEPNAAPGSRFRYTGQQFLGQLNLYYYKARFYSPAIGSFKIAPGFERLQILRESSHEQIEQRFPC